MPSRKVRRLYWKPLSTRNHTSDISYSVIFSGTLVGMLSLGDLACCGACNMEASAALTEISSGVQRRK